MVELTQPEVCSAETQQLWRTLLSWFTSFIQIFFDMVRVIGHYPLLPVSSSSSSSSHSFSPLPVFELPLRDSPDAGSGVNFSGEDVFAATDFTKKLTVVLDLDETLVCAYETSSMPAQLRTQVEEAGLNWFELECASTDKEGEGKSKIICVTVFERPGLHEFLKQLSEFAEVVLFTAGLEGYARPLVDRIDMENRISLRLYRPSTISTQYRDHVKDLSCISKDLCRIVIVDNNPFSFLLQPSNGIPCIPFTAGQRQDTQLLDVILPLLKNLCLHKDVRPVLHERFHMLEWFQKQGIPLPLGVLDKGQRSNQLLYNPQER